MKKIIYIFILITLFSSYSKKGYHRDYKACHYVGTKLYKKQSRKSMKMIKRRLNGKSKLRCYEF